MICAPREGRAVLAVDSVARAEDGVFASPRLIWGFGPHLEIPRLFFETTTSGENERAVRGANQTGVSEVDAELLVFGPFGGIIGSHRAAVAKRMVVGVINDVEITGFVDGESRAAMIVSCLTNRSGS